MNNCGNCRYYKGTYSVREGFCYRYPGTIVYDSNSDDYSTVHPETNMDDWCGEWKELEDCDCRTFDNPVSEYGPGCKQCNGTGKIRR